MKVDAFASNLRGNSPSGVGESTEADSVASTVWAFGQDQGYNAANDYEEKPDIIRGEMSFYNTPLTEKYSGAVYGALREIQEQCSVDFQVMCPNSSPFVNFDYLMGEFVSPIQEQYMFRRRKLSASAALNRFRSGAEYVAYLRSFYSLKFLPQLLHPLSAVMYRDEKSKRFVAAGSKGGGSGLASTQVDGKPKLSNKPRSYSSGRAMTGAPRHVHMGDTHRRLGAAPVAADAAAIDSAAVINEPMQVNAADIAVDNQQTPSSDNRAAAPNFAQLVLDFLHGRDVRLSLTSPFAVLGGHLVQLRPAPQYTQYTLARGGWGDDDDGGYYSYDDSAGADDDAAYYGYDDDAYYSYDDDGAAYYSYDDRAQVDQGEVADGDGGDSYDFYDASTGARADGPVVQARVRPQVQPAQVPAAVAGRWERELEVGDHHDHHDHDHHDHDHDHHHHDHDDGPSSGEGSSGGSSESEEHVHSWFWGGGKGSRGTSSEGDSSSSEGRSSTSSSSDGSSSSSEEHGAWHRAGSPVPPDRSFSGSLGFGEDGDMCLYRGMAQGRVSDPCVDAVSDLYQLRAQYWQESQQQQQGCGHHGMFLVLVVGLFAACLVRRCYAAKHQRKVRSLLTALHTHPALKATVEAETGVKVPVPHPPPSFCCSGQDGGRCNSRALTRFCKVAAVTVALLVLTFWVSLSSLHITGHIVHELDEHAPADPVTGEPQYTSPLFAFTILLGVCTAEITMIALAFRGIKACCDRNNNNCCPAQPSSSSGDQQPPALAGTPGAAQWLGRYVQRVAQRFGGSGGAHEGYVRLPGGEEYAGDNEVLLGARYTAPAAGNGTEMVTIARPAPVPAPAVATAPPQQQYAAMMVPVTAMPVNVVTMV